MSLLALVNNCLGADSKKLTERNLLLYVEGARNLFPVIEEKVRALRIDSSAEPLFHQVRSIKRYEDNARYEKTLRELIGYYSLKPGFLSLSKEGEDLYKKIESQLIGETSFLRVDILPLNNFIEYQFTLIKSVRRREKRPVDQSFNPLDVASANPTLSVVINPASDDYDRAIENALKSIFPETNAPPIPRFTLNSRSVVDKETVVVAVGDTVSLDAYESFDKDTPRNQLRFLWEQLPADHEVIVPQKKILPFDVEGRLQNVTVREEGTYRIQLKVSDGISISQPSMVSLIAIQQPKVYLYPAYLEVKRYASLWGNGDDHGVLVDFLIATSEKQGERFRYHVVRPTIEKKPFSEEELMERLGDNEDVQRAPVLNMEGLMENNAFLYSDEDTLFHYSDPVYSSNEMFQIEEIVGGAKGRMVANLAGGVYDYKIFSDVNGVPSNIQTLTVNVRERRPVSLGIAYSGTLLIYEDKQESSIDTLSNNAIVEQYLDNIRKYFYHFVSPFVEVQLLPHLAHRLSFEFPIFEKVHPERLPFSMTGSIKLSHQSGYNMEFLLTSILSQDKLTRFGLGVGYQEDAGDGLRFDVGVKYLFGKFEVARLLAGVGVSIDIDVK